MHDEDLMTQLAGHGPQGPARMDVHAAIKEGKRRRKVRRAVTFAGLAGVVLIAAAGIPFVLRGQTRADLPIATSPSPVAKDPRYRPHRPVDYVFPTACAVSVLAPHQKNLAASVSGMDSTGQHVTAGLRLWDLRSGSPKDLPGKGGLSDVNALGQAIGGREVGTDIALIYVDGQLTELPHTVLYAINDKGQIAGMSNGKPARWDKPAEPPTLLQLPPDATRSIVRDIDTDGTVFGAVYQGEQSQAYMWGADGAALALSTPVHEGKALVNTHVRAINNGWAIGEGELANGRTLGVRWDLATGETKVFPDLQRVFGISAAGWVTGWLKGVDPVFTDGNALLRLSDLEPSAADKGPAAPHVVSDDGKTIGGKGWAVGQDGYTGTRPVVWRCQ